MPNSILTAIILIGLIAVLAKFYFQMKRIKGQVTKTTQISPFSGEITPLIGSDGGGYDGGHPGDHGHDSGGHSGH